MEIQKHLFSLPDDITYLNCAYMSPLSKLVEETGKRALERKKQPHLITAEDFFSDTESLRTEFAELIRGDKERVVIIPSVSYGMATVARNLPDNGKKLVVVAGEQFPSNVYPWFRLAEERGLEIVTIQPPESDKRGQDWNEQILNSITGDTLMVALSHTHWADGTLFDLKAIRSKTRETGTFLVIDGTQSVGALPFDVSEIDPDALICAGYKWLMGPYSIAMAYYGEVFDNGVPIEENWITRLNSEDFAGLVNYENEYQPGAFRYGTGEQSNFILVPMMLEALKLINQWGPENIQDYCRKISNNAISQIQDMGLWVESEEFRGQHLFGIRLPEGVDIEKVKAEFQQHKIFVSIRGNAIRVSPNVYNSEQDMNKLAVCLAASIS